jgi:hypothetical protein
MALRIGAARLEAKKEKSRSWSKMMVMLFTGFLNPEP